MKEQLLTNPSQLTKNVALPTEVSAVLQVPSRAVDGLTCAPFVLRARLQLSDFCSYLQSASSCLFESTPVSSPQT